VLFAAFLASAILICWRHLSWTEAVAKLTPASLAFASGSLAFLLVEGEIERVVLSLVVIFLPWIVLELLFLSIYDPARYPVNGLSRLNLAFLPLAAFYLAMALNGLLVFVRLPWMWTVGAFTVLGACAFAATEHPAADAAHRRRWLLLGGLLGGQVGALVVALPFSFLVQGAMAALFLAFPLRWRRYAYQPVPSSRQAFVEATLLLGAFALLLTTSRWV
jgi:hypothetical protein